MRIALCTHVFDNVDYDVYFNHIYCVAKWAKKYDLVFVGKKGTDAAEARNKIIEKCFEHDCTHAFFLDGDHFIEASALDYLVELADEAMVSGLICKKGDEFQQVCWEVHDVEGERRYFQVTLPLDGRAYEVSVCAFGCTLINLTMLKKLKKPYFRDTCVDGISTRSDINLCFAFKDIGEKMWVHTRALVGHLGQHRVIYPQDALYHERTRAIEVRERMLRSDQHGEFFDSRIVS